MNTKIMNTSRFTIFALLLVIVGLSACDQIGQLPAPVPPQMDGPTGEIPLASLLR